MITQAQFQFALISAARAFLTEIDNAVECNELDSQLDSQPVGTLNPNPFVPEAEQFVPVAAVEPTRKQKVLNLLNDPRFTLRRATVVQEAAGVGSFTDLVQFFEDNEIYFTTASKRRTGERLVGLAERN